MSSAKKPLQVLVEMDDEERRAERRERMAMNAVVLQANQTALEKFKEFQIELRAVRARRRQEVDGSPAALELDAQAEAIDRQMIETENAANQVRDNCRENFSRDGQRPQEDLELGLGQTTSEIATLGGKLTLLKGGRS